MINSKTFFLTEARANIFKIFKMVEEGQEVVIIKKDSNKRFKVSLVEEAPKVDKVALLKTAPGLGMANLTPLEIKTILNTRLDQCL